VQLIPVSLELVEISQTTDLGGESRELVVADVKLGEGHDEADLRRNLSQLVAAQIKNVEVGEATETTREGGETVGGQVQLTKRTELADLGRKITDMIVEKIQRVKINKRADSSRKSDDLVAAKIHLDDGLRDAIEVVDVLDTLSAKVQAGSTGLLKLIDLS